MKYCKFKILKTILRFLFVSIIVLKNGNFIAKRLLFECCPLESQDDISFLFNSQWYFFGMDQFLATNIFLFLNLRNIVETFQLEGMVFLVSTRMRSSIFQQLLQPLHPFYFYTQCFENTLLYSFLVTWWVSELYTLKKSTIFQTQFKNHL